MHIKIKGLLCACVLIFFHCLLQHISRAPKTEFAITNSPYHIQWRDKYSIYIFKFKFSYHHVPITCVKTGSLDPYSHPRPFALYTFRLPVPTFSKYLFLLLLLYTIITIWFNSFLRNILLWSILIYLFPRIRCFFFWKKKISLFWKICHKISIQNNYHC